MMLLSTCFDCQTPSELLLAINNSGAGKMEQSHAGKMEQSHASKMEQSHAAANCNWQWGGG